MLAIAAIIALMIVAFMFMAMPGTTATLTSDVDPLSVAPRRLTIMRFIGLGIFLGALALTMVTFGE